MTAVDYSIYLVTDSGMIPSGKTLLSQVEDAINGGVTIVQLREKNLDTGDFVDLAFKVKELTKAAGIPLIINDRLDVALAVDADGVHVGQDDMDVAILRQWLGPHKIVGLSVNNVKEAEEAIKKDIDYVGIGSVFGTKTKDLKAAPIGPSGVRKVLNVITSSDKKIRTVAIGGINESNTHLVRHTCFASGGKENVGLDGIAVVSAIMASENAKLSTQALTNLWTSIHPYTLSSKELYFDDAGFLKESASSIIRRVHETSPLTHHITNAVVKNFSANITIAAGATPIMSECPEEFDDLSKIPGSGLLVNMGMATEEGIAMFQKAIRAYNAQGKPVVFDPVGAGATSLRKRAVRTLLDSGLYSVIKGNEGEILSVVGSGGQMKGVDSIASGLSTEAKLQAVRKLAREHRTTVLMTAERDILVNGFKKSCVALEFANGHKYLGKITGSGCVLGSLITAYCAAAPEDTFRATGTALLLYTLAAERAASRSNVSGPGTFVPALIDCIYELGEETCAGNDTWLEGMKVTVLK